MTYTIQHLTFGSVLVPPAFAVAGVGDGSPPREVPIYGFLLLGGDAPVLVDAGLRSVEVYERGGPPARIADGCDLESQLGRHGVEIGDLGCVLMTHLHVDHTGHLESIPMSTPVAVQRAEMSHAFSGLQGLAYCQEDLHHLVDRSFTRGALRYLDLDLTGDIEVLDGVVCTHAGGHTPGSMNLVVETAGGPACICGDLVFDVDSALVEPLGQIAADEPAVTGMCALSKRDEIAAIKKSLRHPLIVPSHDLPAAVEHGRVVERFEEAAFASPVDYQAAGSPVA